MGLQTALQDACVCLYMYVCLLVCLWPYAVNFKYMKIKVQRQLSGVKVAQVEACTPTYCLFVMAATDRPSTAGCSPAINGRLLADRTNYRVS